MTEQQGTPEELREAHRTATAMALAGWRNDAASIGELWSGSPNKAALIYALSRLPATLMRAASERQGYTLDPEEVLGDLLHNLPSFINPEEGDTDDE